MTRYFHIILLFVFLCNGIAKSDEYQPYVEGQVVENSISIGKGKYNIPLPAGKFTIVATYESKTSSSNKTQLYDIGMVTLKGKTLDKYVRIRFSKPTSTWWELPKDCKRENIYFFKSYNKGNAFSCWFVNHIALQLTSTKIKKDSFFGKLKDYIINNQIIIPNIAIYSQHLYSSPRHKNVYFLVRYYENPELSGVAKGRETNWHQSEYQPTKIFQYPKKKAFMENYIIKSAKYQRDFETGIGMLPEHRLDTSIANQGNEGSKSQEKPSDIVGELDKLNKLYKSGALTKSEFEVAKKKLLKN